VRWNSGEGGIGTRIVVAIPVLRTLFGDGTLAHRSSVSVALVGVASFASPG